jgi:hypothetical protein
VPTKNITLSAEESAIEQARAYMRSQNRTLNDAFREWVEDLSAEYRVKAFHAFLEKTRGRVVSDGPYTRDELNERR